MAPNYDIGFDTVSQKYSETMRAGLEESVDMHTGYLWYNYFDQAKQCVFEEIYEINFDSDESDLKGAFSGAEIRVYNTEWKNILELFMEKNIHLKDVQLVL